jgi:hypothetical protein
MALITMAMMAGCAPAADAPNPEPTQEAESQEPTPTQSPTSEPDLDPAAAREYVVEACTVIATKNFVEPGVQDALREAAGLANDAAAADAQWEPLSMSLNLLAIAYVLRENDPAPFDSALPSADSHCDALGVSLAG